MPSITIRKSKAELDVKRFYLPGVTITDHCPSCRKLRHFDGDSEYISNPILNEPEAVTMYCEDCEENWEVDVVLTLVVTLAKRK